MTHGSRGHEVLLVDDEEMFLSSLFEGLCRRFPDMTFRTAHDGEAALDTLGKHAVDLVITDLKMPRMDGFQLIAAMHSRYPRIPLLIMTAHSTELSAGRALAAGALHCIDKPVDLCELSRRIDELFSTGAIASLRGVSLAAFLQLLGLERKSGIIDVQGEHTRALLFLSNGQVIHADDGTRTGLQAALRIVSLDDVEIHFRPGAVPKTPTIDLPLTQLLLDAARLRDEGRHDKATEDLDLAFSELFSGAFDERLGEPEMADEPATLLPVLAGPRIPTASPMATTARMPTAPAALDDSAPIPRTISTPLPSLPGGFPPPRRGAVAFQPPATRMLGLRSAGPLGAGAVAHPLGDADSSAIPLPITASSTSTVTAVPQAIPEATLSGPTTTPNSAPMTFLRSAPVAVRLPPSTPYSTLANVSDAVATSLRRVAEIGGVLGAAFVDFHSAEILGSVTRDHAFDTAAMARANVEVVRAKLALLESLGERDGIEDIVITTRAQYHVLCMSERRPRHFLFVAMVRDQATLALARFLIDEAVQSSSGSAA